MNDSIFTKMMKSLQESKLTEGTISDVEETKPEDVDVAEGTVEDVVAVVDPDLTSDDYEKVIAKAEETIEETPEGEQPSDSQYVGNNIYTCPICGNAFFTDVELGEGDACPVCSEVPEAFIYNGKVDNGLTDEDQELMDNMEDEVVDKEIPEEGTEEGEEEIPVEETTEEIPEEETPRHESLETNLDNSKRLDEVRRVERKRIVIAYDFNELNDEIKEKMISRHRKEGTNSYEDIVKEESELQFKKKFAQFSFITNDIGNYSGSLFYYFKDDGEMGKNKEAFVKECSSRIDLPMEINFSDLSSDLVGDEYTEGFGEDKETKRHDKIRGRFSLTGYSYNLKENVMHTLYDDSNYPELPKASKKVIASKINEIIEQVRETFGELFDYMKDLMSKNIDSISELKKLQDKPIIEMLSQYWYTEKGSEICNKKDAKVVANESLLTEAPVNLEFDDSFDVYNYNELDDNGKRRAFSDKKHLADNLYGKRWPELRNKIEEYLKDYMSKLGIEAKVDVRDENAYIQIYEEPLLKYIKDNGINAEKGDSTNWNGEVYDAGATIKIGMVGGYRNKFNVSLSNIKGDSKDLVNELTMDIEAVYNNIMRMIKQAHEQADADYKAKMSKQNKEYLKNGQEYKGND